MTMPPEEIEVICPKCGRQYKDWWRPSINLSLGERFDEEYLDAATSSTCPHCHFKVRHDVLIVGEDGVWQVGSHRPDWQPTANARRKMQRGTSQLITRFDEFIETFNNAVEADRTFGGPSLYFHCRCITEYHQVPLVEKLADSRFTELIYAVLASWGMHRMGDTSTKLHNYAHFREQILGQRDHLIALEALRIRDLTEDTMEAVLRRTGDMLDQMRISKSDSHLVATTKVLHHILPDLIPPIDRNYTLRFFGLTTMLPSQKTARSIFTELFPCFAQVAKAIPSQIQGYVRLGQENWHTSFTKVIDSAIVGALLKDTEARS